MINYKKQWRKRKKAEIKRLVVLMGQAIIDAQVTRIEAVDNPLQAMAMLPLFAAKQAAIAVIYCHIQTVISTPFKQRGKLISRMGVNCSTSA